MVSFYLLPFLSYCIIIIAVVVEFFHFLSQGERYFHGYKSLFIDLVFVILIPSFFLLDFDFGVDNNCCTLGSVFSPSHRLSVYFLIAICMASYLYSSLKSTVYSPILEVAINSFLLIGIVLNVFIILHIDAMFWVVGNVPILLLFIMVLFKNHHKLLAHGMENGFGLESRLNYYSWKILTARPFFKYPILVVLCIPLLFVLISFLLLFGQKPDSFVQAFTKTFKHGFSELDYLCENVECGGHYLCSVAAKGHKKVVQPTRIGYRNNKMIICNRQLLVSNAFEELLEERIPVIHRFVRQHYNKVGNMIHKYYYFFEIKLVADFVYLIMKPMEWFFVTILYLFDTRPETRIELQYLKKIDRDLIEKQLTTDLRDY